jgi:hypothetical protein
VSLDLEEMDAKSLDHVDSRALGGRENDVCLCVCVFYIYIFLTGWLSELSYIGEGEETE